MAALVSGGLDSSVMLGQIAQRCPVYPIYVRMGLTWENIEREYLERFLDAIKSPTLYPLVVLEQPVRDLYGKHWSTGGAAPNAAAPDEEVYLPGRNVLLLSKALIWCRLHDVPTIALAVLSANPFPDATTEFFRSYAGVVNQAVGGHVEVVTPFASMSKADVIRRGADLPVQHTLSCMSPKHDRHCGECNKCAERGRAFRAAGVPDPTDYISRAWQNAAQRPANSRPWE